MRPVAKSLPPFGEREPDVLSATVTLHFSVAGTEGIDMPTLLNRIEALIAIILCGSRKDGVKRRSSS